MIGWVIYSFVLGIIIANIDWKGVMAPSDAECLWCKTEEHESTLEYIAYRYPNDDKVFAGQACWFCHSRISDEISRGDLIPVL